MITERDVARAHQARRHIKECVGRAYGWQSRARRLFGVDQTVISRYMSGRIHTLWMTDVALGWLTPQRVEEGECFWDQLEEEYDHFVGCGIGHERTVILLANAFGVSRGTVEWRMGSGNQD